jgi:hypothetical protein
VIEDCGIPGDDTVAFESVDASLCRRRRQADQSTELARRATGVPDQSGQDVPVGLVECWSRCFQIIKQMLFLLCILKDVEAVTMFLLDFAHEAQPQSGQWR